jgi:hypothetical protein
MHKLWRLVAAAVKALMRKRLQATDPPQPDRPKEPGAWTLPTADVWLGWDVRPAVLDDWWASTCELEHCSGCGGKHYSVHKRPVLRMQKNHVQYLVPLTGPAALPQPGVN